MNIHWQTLRLYRYPFVNQLERANVLTFFLWILGGIYFLTSGYPIFSSYFVVFLIASLICPIAIVVWSIGRAIFAHQYVRGKKIEFFSKSQESFSVLELETVMRGRFNNKPTCFWISQKGKDYETKIYYSDVTPQTWKILHCCADIKELFVYWGFGIEENVSAPWSYRF